MASPSLDSLRVFEVAARRLSFKEAGAELCITPAAVSQRIRQLEEVLDVALFRRLTRQVVLTEDGQVLAARLREGLGIIDDAIGEIRERRAARPLILATHTTFAEQCLLPRIGDAQLALEGAELRLLVSDDLVDLAREPVDLAVRQGSGDYPGTQSRMLFPGRYVAVCTATVARAWTAAPLIHVDWPARIVSAPGWAAWFALVGCQMPPGAGAIHVASESMAIKAALAGHGLALVHLAHAAKELESGALVRPFAVDRVLETDLAHHLVRAPRRRHPRADALWGWLLATFGQQNG